MGKETDKLKEILRKKQEPPPESTSSYLSTGSTLLNLALTGNARQGYPTGHYLHIVGDSESGKSWLAMSALAEASIDPAFKDYRLIYDNPENGMLVDIEYYFGPKLVSRIEAPKEKDGELIYSATTEEFYYYLDDAIEDGRPFIYVLDSMDSLDTEEEEDAFDKAKEAHRKGKEVGGSYGTAKAKLNSRHLRVVSSRLRQTGSILMIVSQTRSNIGYGAQYNPRTYSGGNALKFYASIQFWTSIKERIKAISRKKGKEKSRQVGVRILTKITKNRVNGTHHEIEIPFYTGVGIDDTGSMIDWLIEEGHWTKGQTGYIETEEFQKKLTKEGLVALIEDDNREDELRKLVTTVWEEIANDCKVKRKNRYA